MAQVTLQAVVNFDQVNKLQETINKLNGTKINLSTTSFTKSIKDSEKISRELLKTEKERQRVIVEETKARKEAVRVETEQQKKRTAEAQTERETIRNQREAVKLQREKIKAQQEEERATKNANEEVKKQGLLYDILGRSVSSFIVRMAAYRAVYAGIRAITNGFQEALTTLKAVDDELVTVRKVTGFDQYQMAQVEEQAYAVASKYGTSAADYTSSVAAFARAGYKNLSGDLAELAEKTKIVGDTTADVAQQFLLSVDAAYKYKGNIEALTAVLDGANEIDNKYATSIEKIAEGMGIVAPVAAQMNVSVDELAASIGTITAVTQRTGTEAARALRAIYLNIVGDTKTEIEEGVTWTTGEIEGLRDVIKLYAKDAWNAAQASGGIIDPMEAIAGLSKSVKDGILTEAQLMAMVSDIGGKLRTSQLLALINNWDMYESMLADYNNAYGSAEKEIENAMDSWTRKSEVLKNTWTQFVKTGLNSEAFKGFLDILTSIVQRLGSLPGVLTRIAVIVVGLKFDSIAKSLSKIVDSTGKLKFNLSSMSVIITGIGIAWSAVSYILESAKRRHEEIIAAIYETADAAKEDSDKIISLYADFNSAKEGSDALTESAKKLAEALGNEIPEGAEKAGKALTDLTIQQLKNYLDDQYEAVKTAKEEFASIAESATSPGIFDNLLYNASINRSTGSNVLDEMWAALLTNTEFYTKRGPSGVRAQNAAGEWYDVDDGIFDFTASGVENLQQYRKALEEIVEKTQELARINSSPDLLDEEQYLAAKRYLVETAEAFDKMNQKLSDYDSAETKLRFLELSSTIRVDSVEAYERLIKTINLKNRGSDEEREALIALAKLYYPQFAQAVDDSTDSVNSETDALKKNSDALDEDASSADRAAAAKKRAEEAVRIHLNALVTETGELTDAGRAAFIASKYLADLTQAELNARKEAAQANYAALRAELATVTAEALRAATALAFLRAGNSTGKDDDEWLTEKGILTRKKALEAQLRAMEQEINAINASMVSVAPYTSSYSSGSSGGGSGGGSSSSAEDAKLTALRARVTLLKSELSLMQARGDSEEDQIAKMREIMSALEAERQYLASIKGDQATINGLAEEWWNYQNKITDLQEQAAEAAQQQADAVQAALEATIALANAEKQRSVRVYNAATGQWEWQADPSAVASAQEAYNNAMSGLSDEERVLYQQALAEWLQTLQNLGANGGMNPSGTYIPANIGSSTLSNLLNNINNGSTFNFGNFTLTEAQAKAISLFDFARLSGALVAYNNSV